MKTFEIFKTNFLDLLSKSRKSSPLNDREIRDTWGIDAEQMVRKQNTPSTKAFFSFSNGSGQCPVCLLIRCLKNHIDPYRIILFIMREFNISNENLQNYIKQNNN